VHLTYRGAETTGRSRKPLSLRGGAAHTFRNILAFLSVVLLAIGAYELTEVIAHPLEGQSTEIIGAAVLIALAAIMVFYVIRSHGCNGGCRLNPHAQRGARQRRNPRSSLPSGSWNRREIALFQKAAVMQFMAGGNKSQRSDANFVFIGHAAARPGFIVERSIERDGRAAHRGKLFRHLA